MTEDMTTLSNRRSILDVALLADNNIKIPNVENLPRSLKTFKPLSGKGLVLIYKMQIVVFFRLKTKHKWIS